jgi:hypothetical protein
MRIYKVNKSFYILIFLSLCFCGCEQTAKPPSQITVPNPIQADGNSVYAMYSAEKTTILPLTEFAINQVNQQGEIKLFISLLDAFSSQIKSPCTFRFELYMKLPRSSDPKGQRVMIWPDIDLNDPKINNDYWRDFLRAYEFKLSFEPQTGQSYILEVTCLCPNKKRLLSEFILKNQNESN